MDRNAAGDELKLCAVSVLSIRAANRPDLHNDDADGRDGRTCIPKGATCWKITKDARIENFIFGPARVVMVV